MIRDVATAVGTVLVVIIAAVAFFVGSAAFFYLVGLPG